MASVRLLAVGDVMLGEDHLMVGRGVGSVIRRHGADYVFFNVQSILRDSDISFGNLEAVLSKSNLDNGRLSSLAMRADPESAEALKHAGFNVLSLANNHMRDHGAEALRETLMALSDASINHIGAGEDASFANNKPLVVVRDGIRVAFLAYCLVPDGRGCIVSGNHEEICSQTRIAKKEADILVISLHWGEEYMEYPSPAQIELAHRIIDSGANIVLGHHPHVVQGIEEYHQGIIAYSLGNFLFGLDYLEMTKTGVILKCEFSRERIIRYELIPTGTDSDHRPKLLEGKEKDEVLASLNRLSKNLTDRESSGYEQRATEYRDHSATIMRTVRRMMVFFFVKNIYKYPPKYAIQIVADFAKKRLLKVHP